MDLSIFLLAEIADKEPAISFYWSVSLILSIVTILLGQLHRWLPLAMLPMIAGWAWGMYDSMTDPNIGPTIVRELGISYVAQQLASAALPLLPIVHSIWRGRKRDIGVAKSA